MSLLPITFAALGAVVGLLVGGFAGSLLVPIGSDSDVIPVTLGALAGALLLAWIGAWVGTRLSLRSAK